MSIATRDQRVLLNFSELQRELGNMSKTGVRALIQQGRIREIDLGSDVRRRYTAASVQKVVAELFGETA